MNSCSRIDVDFVFQRRLQVLPAVRPCRHRACAAIVAAADRETEILGDPLVELESQTVQLRAGPPSFGCGSQVKVGRLASSATLGSSISSVLMNMWGPAKPWAKAGSLATASRRRARSETLDWHRTPLICREQPKSDQGRGTAWLCGECEPNRWRAWLGADQSRSCDGVRPGSDGGGASICARQADSMADRTAQHALMVTDAPAVSASAVVPLSA